MFNFVFVALILGQVTPLPKAAQQIQTMESLSKELADLKKELTDLKELTDAITTRVDRKKDDFAVAFLDTDSRTVDRVDSTNGSFVVAIEDVVPYLDGFKVKLRFGNLTTAAFSRAELDLVWTPRGKFVPSKRKKETFNQCLAPGQWTFIEIVLPSTKPEELGRIAMSIDTPTMSFACK